MLVCEDIVWMFDLYRLQGTITVVGHHFVVLGWFIYCQLCVSFLFNYGFNTIFKKVDGWWAR